MQAEMIETIDSFLENDAIEFLKQQGFTIIRLNRTARNTVVFCQRRKGRYTFTIRDNGGVFQGNDNANN